MCSSSNVNVRQRSFSDRLIRDVERGEQRDGNIRYMMLRPDVLMGTFTELPAAHRKAALDALFRSALANGGKSVRAYQDGGSNDPFTLMETMKTTAAQLGWGVWEFSYSEDGERLDLEVINSPFASGFGVSELPVCHAIKGLFQAMGPVVLGTNISVEESQCTSQNISLNRCIFSMNKF